ncbi:MAG: hypothetical protein L3K09_07675 [Thermoplasmata archaeon]|nr:hypothetical protein [Thermoplasmata archaeon]
MSSTHGDARAGPGREVEREAEAALRRLGYARIPPVGARAPGEPEFWVQEAGVPRRTFPVYVAQKRSPSVERRLLEAGAERKGGIPRAIVVVANDQSATETWERFRQPANGPVDTEVAILVMRPRDGEAAPYWHRAVVSPKELLRLATGVVVGLFRRAKAGEGSGQIDFEEMIGLLESRFHIDVHRSLGVNSNEDALFLLYQLAQRDSYAPGDAASNLHLLVLRPTGPAARLPWFAA